MPLNSNVWLRRGHRFGQKIEFTVMELNHGGKPLGTILGPMGSHWDQKMGQNRKKLPCPKIRVFDYFGVIDLGSKSNLRLWLQITVGTPRVHLEVKGVPSGPKNGSKPSKITMPQKSIFLLLRAVIDLGKNRFDGNGAKSRWGPPRVHLGANGVPLGPKNGYKR